MKKYLKLFFVFFKIGLFTLGGGLAMVPIIRDEFVNKAKWISDEEITDVFAVSQSLPGVIAINSSIYMGYKISGFLGAVVATLGVVLPSFLIIYIIFLFFTPEIANNPYLIKAFKGINAGITALIFNVAFSLGKKSITDIFGCIIALFSFCMIFFVKLDIGYIVIVSAVVGYIYHKIKEKNKSK